MIIFVFTRFLYHGMIYNLSEFQKAKFQAFHKIFANKEWEIQADWVILGGPVKSVITSWDGEYTTEDMGKEIHNNFSFERWLLWDNPVKIFRKE